MQTTARNATLGDLAGLLRDQQTRKLDVVAGAETIEMDGGLLRLSGTESILTEDGVTTVDGTYRPTAIFDEGISDKLGIPLKYVRRLREERPDLYDANVNGLLHGTGPAPVGVEFDVVPPDARRFLLRTFRGDDGGEGIARAFLSDSYRRIDNLDVLTSALEGIRDSGAEVDVEACDLTERRMYVRVVSPEVRALAPTLLANYRSPFDNGVERAGGWTLERGREIAAREGLGHAPGTEPVVFAGFIVSNSETGGGAFTITPRLVIEVCRNGLTINVDALRSVHLGSKLDEGIVRWADDTQQANLDLVAKQARDAVATFLDRDYVEQAVGRIEEQAGATLAKPADTIREVGSALRIPQDRVEGILDHFIRGGQPTAGGVLNAVTSYAQTIPDADEAAEMEGLALRALDLAAR